MKIVLNPETNYWHELVKRPAFDQKKLFLDVEGIMKKVEEEGDKALIDFAKKFDNVILDSVLVSENEFNTIIIPQSLKSAISIAKANIEKFHKNQIESIKKVETSQGVVCWRKSIAIEKVGLYIPGGSAPLFSTLLMLGIPAKLAGCTEISVCTPPTKDGKVADVILYTAQLLGIKKVFKVGGAQAIAAMTFGTESIPKASKLFGPGNQYVTAAKQIAQKKGVAIDMPAGPSEVLVIADDSCIPEFVAADLLSQAEHGADSQVVLVSNSEQTANSILDEVEKQLQKLPRKDSAIQSLAKSFAIVVNDLDTAMNFSNLYAPEHLILAVKDFAELAEKVINAGSVFLGNYSCESAGDYASGTNHTLPTNGYATAYSGVSLDSFVKKVTFQHLSQQGLSAIGSAIETMAEAEGLYAHKNAVNIRLKRITQK